MVTKEEIIEKFETVLDPEIGVDIYTMGLIYGIDIKSEKAVKILMTFTNSKCPMGDFLCGEVEGKLKELGFENIDIEITFDPPWDYSMVKK